MKASGIVYLVLKGLPTPVSAASHWSRTGNIDGDGMQRALEREETIHAFLSQLIRARALVRLGFAAAGRATAPADATR
ncbi:MAG TPA: hypothetical protein VH542_00485 [Steroidobacteraceae bacterium]